MNRFSKFNKFQNQFSILINRPSIINTFKSKFTTTTISFNITHSNNNNNNNNIKSNIINKINYYQKNNNNNNSNSNSNSNSNNNNNNNFKNNFEFKFGNWSKEEKERYFKSAKTSSGLIYSLIAINSVIFLFVNSNPEDYSHKKKIYETFYLSLDNFQYNPTTLITHFFTHQSLGHFLFNMLGLYTIGPVVLNAIGTSSFFGLYMASGIASGLSLLALQKYYRDDAKRLTSLTKYFGNQQRYQKSMQRSITPAIGASGAIFGVLAVFASLFPRATLSLYGIIPIPAVAAVGGFIAYDIYSEVSQSETGISHIGHLGGAAYGLLYYFFKLRGRY